MANEMMGLIGRKVGMTQFFRDDGEVVAVTVIETGPCTVLQVKTEDGADGYNAIQLGFGTQKESRTTKPQLGHFKKAGASVKRFVKEIRLSKDQATSFTPGQEISADVFEVGQRVDVTGVLRQLRDVADKLLHIVIVRLQVAHPPAVELPRRGERDVIDVDAGLDGFPPYLPGERRTTETTQEPFPDSLR